MAVVLAYFSLVGCAILGLPAVLALAKRGYGSAPAIVAASIALSLVTLVPLGLLSPLSPRNVAEVVGYLVPDHVALALGFAFGARLPWRFEKQMQ